MKLGSIFKGELTGRKVLAYFVGFFFVVFGANAIMTYVAVTTFSGVETDDAYRKGRDYNETLAKARAQQALGWNVSLQIAQPGPRQLSVSASIQGDQGAPLSDMVVSATLRRPTHQGMDQEGMLIEIAKGTYTRQFNLPASGNWQVNIKAQSPSGDYYRLEKQIVVKE